MQKYGHIDEKVFSIAVNHSQHNESTVTYGGYNMKKFAEPGAEL